MKLIIILLLISQCLFAHRFEINTLETASGYDSRFNMYESQTPKDLAILDCQSFFQKFDIYNKFDELISENYISISECEEIYLNAMSCIDSGMSKCVDTNNIFNTKCSCTE